MILRSSGISQWNLRNLECVASTPPWFSRVKEGLLERVLRLAAAADDGVALGFHLCYGDLGHRHFVEPKDTAVLVEIGNAILKGATRSVDWMHLLVPKSRVDAAYFAPLNSWNWAIRSFILDCCIRMTIWGRWRGLRLRGRLLRPLGLRLSVGWGDRHKQSWIAFSGLRRV